jgi:hypothetical protein
MANVRHFLQQHGTEKMYDEYSPGDQGDEYDKQNLEVEVGEESDLRGGTTPFVRVCFNRPITPEQRDKWFDPGSPDYPYRVHQELNYVVADGGSAEPARNGEEHRDLQLMTITSARVMLGSVVEGTFETKATVAEQSEAWMVAHFLWNGQPKIHEPMEHPEEWRRLV